MSQGSAAEQALQSNGSNGKRKKFDFVRFLEKYGVLMFLILLIVFFTTQNKFFLSGRNIANILDEVSIYGIMAVGMTYVIITSGIDLSVGAILAFCSMCAAVVITMGGDPEWLGAMSGVVALLVCCAVGTGVGFVQGITITKFNVQPFIVTLGGLTVWRGATLILNNGAPISGFNDAYRWWGRGDLFGIPIPVLAFFIVALCGFVALRYTRFGRRVLAVGGNPEAARLSGVNVKNILLSVYVLSGFLAGLAGFLLSAQLGSSEAVAGLTYELRVIASVVIGGTSLMGGIGGIGGTMIGALLIGVLMNGLVMMNVSAYYQQVIIGAIIVLAVMFDTYAKSRSGGRR